MLLTSLIEKLAENDPHFEIIIFRLFVKNSGDLKTQDLLLFKDAVVKNRYIKTLDFSGDNFSYLMMMETDKLSILNELISIANIIVLNLRYNFLAALKPSYFMKLIDAVAINKNIISLDLSVNELCHDLSNKAYLHFTKFLAGNKSIITLNLSSNGLSRIDAKRFGMLTNAIGKNKNIKKLILQENCLFAWKYEIVAIFAKFIEKNDSIDMIDLRNNLLQWMKKNHIVMLFEALKINPRIIRLQTEDFELNGTNFQIIVSNKIYQLYWVTSHAVLFSKLQSSKFNYVDESIKNEKPLLVCSNPPLLFSLKNFGIRIPQCFSQNMDGHSYEFFSNKTSIKDIHQDSRSTIVTENVVKINLPTHVLKHILTFVDCFGITNNEQKKLSHNIINKVIRKHQLKK